jgi:hypothetical protein
VARTRTARTERKGFSLAKGPIGLIGLAMIAYGVIAFLMGGDSFTSDPPDGIVSGDTFLGLEGNGWTNLLWVGGGLLLVLSAPMHWGAKTMGLIVGLVLAAATVISIFDGPDVFGIFAANDTTTLVWGIAAAALLLLALLPRVGRKRGAATDDRAVVARDGDRDRRHRRDVEPLEREAYERGRRDAERELTGEHHRTPRFGKERDVERDRTAVAADGRDERAQRDEGGFRRL